MTAIIPFSIFFFVRLAFAILYPLLLFAIISPLLSIGKRILPENSVSRILTLPFSQAKLRRRKNNVNFRSDDRHTPNNAKYAKFLTKHATQKNPQNIFHSHSADDTRAPNKKRGFCMKALHLSQNQPV